MKLYKSKINFKESFHQKDNLFSGITFEDLIIAVQSNEQVIDKKSVRKVFTEMYQANFKDALSELRSNMKQIIKEAQR